MQRHGKHFALDERRDIGLDRSPQAQHKAERGRLGHLPKTHLEQNRRQVSGLLLGQHQATGMRHQIQDTGDKADTVRQQLGRQLSPSA